MAKPDFTGYATRNDLLCGDGRTIRSGAFKGNEGKRVPLIWNHIHNDPDAVLGHAILKNVEDGVYAYGYFNESESGKACKELLKHGDIEGLSIWANQLKQIGNDVIHGNIRELSLVVAGANPGAFVDFVMAHGDDEEGGVKAFWDAGAVDIYHSDDEDDVPESEEKEEELQHSDEKKEEKEEKKDMDGNEKKDKTVQEVIDSMNEEQRTVMNYVIGQVLEDAGVDLDEEDGGEVMKHNLFDNDDTMVDGGYLSHSAQSEILAMAKTSQVGTFQTALEIYAQQNNLQHDAVSSGFVQTGEGNVSELFPEYKDVRPGAPELITNDQGWVSVVMGKVHKSPIARIRTRHADIRNIQELRAKGYKKGKKKPQTGNFNLVTRTTDPQTVHVNNALHRDDVLDIEDFDYVEYLYNIDKMSLNEEIATAIMIGDGRESGSEGKIEEDKIRPIWLDDELYTMHFDLDIAAARQELQGTNTGANFGANYIIAEAMVNTCLYSREKFKGSGTPDLYCTPHMLNVMLLARDLNGRRIYSSKAELASSLNVANIYTVEQFEGKTRTTEDNKVKKLVALIVNLADYSLGSVKGGQVTHFTDFDLDFNQLKSLLETRCSGANTRVYSAIAIEEDVTPASGGTTEEEDTGSDVG